MWAELAAAIVSGIGLAIFTMVRREKTSPAQARHQRIRARLLHLIEGKPGIRLSNLWKAVGVSRTTVQYHLIVLTRTGDVAPDARKGTSRYYAKNGIERDRDVISLLRRGRMLELVAAMLDRPGSCQREITRRLRMRRNMFRKYANLLVAQKLVDEARDGNRQRYFPLPRLNEVLRIVHDYEASGPDGQTDSPGRDLA